MFAVYDDRLICIRRSTIISCPAKSTDKSLDFSREAISCQIIVIDEFHFIVKVINWLKSIINCLIIIILVLDTQDLIIGIHATRISSSSIMCSIVISFLFFLFLFFLDIELEIGKASYLAFKLKILVRVTKFFQMLNFVKS